jgi:hypothetical protein
MTRVFPCLAAAIVAGLLVLASQAKADDVTAISTGGQGDFTMCPAWWIDSECRVYHHIRLPAQIAVGDKVGLRFGSNPKHYRFPVVRILRNGDSCSVFSQTSETEDVEKIEVASCQVMPGAK